jgi:tetratricopeptide (TPR) repeat protein
VDWAGRPEGQQREAGRAERGRGQRHHSRATITSTPAARSASTVSRGAALSVINMSMSLVRLRRTKETAALWQRMADIYKELTEDREKHLAVRRSQLDDGLRRLDRKFQIVGEQSATDAERGIIREAAQLDLQQRELDQLKAARQFYQLLSDFAEGCSQFLALFERAGEEGAILFQELLVAGMQRFLPGEGGYAFADYVGRTIDKFHEWLKANRLIHLEVGFCIARHLLLVEQPGAALELLDRLPQVHLDKSQRYVFSSLRGEACMRIPGRVRESLPHFEAALESAADTTPPGHILVIADAREKLGSYYRNEGIWHEADLEYRRAWEAISEAISIRGTDEYYGEIASIQTSRAYVMGLVGRYRVGENLAQSAIAIRSRLGKRHAEGGSWSVCGEVYRYERRFEKAWEAYSEAEGIFQQLSSWPWLGVIYQQQAICLFQAALEGVRITPQQDSIGEAKRLIVMALDICRDQNIRSYPSALNRAGRIYGHDDADAGMRYLVESVDSARKLLDGWFWFAGLVEYAELSRRTWQLTGERRCLNQIAERSEEIRRLMEEFSFPYLRGRWNVLQGHLTIHEYLETGKESLLSSALQCYKEGFAQLGQGSIGFSGGSAVPDNFHILAELLSLLSPDIRAKWLGELQRCWSGMEDGSDLLLARLDELRFILDEAASR